MSTWLASQEVRAYIGSVGYVGLMVLVVALLVFYEIPESNSEPFYILIGMFVASFDRIVAALTGKETANKEMELLQKENNTLQYQLDAKTKECESQELKHLLCEEKMKIEIQSRERLSEQLKYFMTEVVEKISELSNRNLDIKNLGSTYEKNR